MKRMWSCLWWICAVACAPLGAQDFGFADTEGTTQESSGVRVGGEVGFSAVKYFDDWDDFTASGLDAGARAHLDVDASGGKVDAALHLDLRAAALRDDPWSVLDEAYLRVGVLEFLDLEGGVRKVSWGRADTLGVLDVVNPLDLTDLTVSDPLDQKMGQTMLRVVARLGAHATLDAVYLPFFEPDRIAETGRWAPQQAVDLRQVAYDRLHDELYEQYRATAFSAAYTAAYSMAYPLAYEQVYAGALAALVPADQAATLAGAAAAHKANQTATTVATEAVTAQDALLQTKAAQDAEAGLGDLVVTPDTRTFAHGQAGARLAASLGPLDMGVQYFFGYLHTPVVDTNPASIADNGGKVPVAYNRYHHAGVDAAVVVAGFALRMEAGVNMTNDPEGDDPLVYNPSIGWAAGLDRDVFAGINVNVQAKGRVRLRHAAITSEYDVEHGQDLTATQVAVAITQRLFRDTVEWRLAGVLSPEDLDFALDPSLTLHVGDASVELFGRIFGGNAEGDLGQFADQSYAGLRLSYQF